MTGEFTEEGEPGESFAEQLKALIDQMALPPSACADLGMGKGEGHLVYD